MYIFLSPPIFQLNPVLLAIIVDLGQNFPPAQQLLDAHFEKLFAFQTTFLAIDCTPTLFPTAQQWQPAFPQSCFRFPPPEATYIFALRSSISPSSKLFLNRLKFTEFTEMWHCESADILGLPSLDFLSFQDKCAQRIKQAGKGFCLRLLGVDLTPKLTRWKLCRGAWYHFII